MSPAPCPAPSEHKELLLSLLLCAPLWAVAASCSLSLTLTLETSGACFLGLGTRGPGLLPVTCPRFRLCLLGSHSNSAAALPLCSSKIQKQRLELFCFP